MVAASVMVGTAATFFSLGGIFCLYIHSVSKTMRRAYSQDLKCGESVENRVCCERDIDNTEFRCSREGICGNKPKEKILKPVDENESNIYILPSKELSLNEKTSNLSNDKTLTKMDEYNTKIGLSKESLGSMEVNETKIGEESNIDIVNSKNSDLTKNEIDIEDDAKEEGPNLKEKKNFLIEKEKTALEQIQTNEREGEATPQNQNPPMNKNDEKKRKREEKEAKKLQQKEMRKREKENKKKMLQEKKKISKEEKNKKKGEKSLKINRTHSTKKKFEQKNDMNDENEIEETISYREIEQAHSCYQKIKAILESGRNKN